MVRFSGGGIVRYLYSRERTVGMQEVIFEVETITPLFLAGADQETAEIRAPSFRGEMRYWLRALVSANAKNLETVMVAETKVFGSTDVSSMVGVRISQPDSDPIHLNEN